MGRPPEKEAPRGDRRETWAHGLAIVVLMLLCIGAVLGALGWFVEMVTGGAP